MEKTDNVIIVIGVVGGFPREMIMRPLTNS